MQHTTLYFSYFYTFSGEIGNNVSTAPRYIGSGLENTKLRSPFLATVRTRPSSISRRHMLQVEDQQSEWTGTKIDLLCGGITILLCIRYSSRLGMIKKPTFLFWVPVQAFRMATFPVKTLVREIVNDLSRPGSLFLFVMPRVGVTNRISLNSCQLWSFSW